MKRSERQLGGSVAWLTFAALVAGGVGASSFTGIARAQLTDALPPYTLDLTFQNEANAQTGSSAPLRIVSAQRAAASLVGTEVTQCNPQYGRRSYASALASGNVVQQGVNSIHFRLAGSVFAQGGHYNTYVTCFGPIGFGSQGHDTMGASTAKPTASVILRFAANASPADYKLRVSSGSTGGTITVKLADDQQKDLSTQLSGDGTILLDGSPGRSYTVSVSLPLQVSNNGGCCSSRLDAAADVTLAVEIASVASSDRQTPLSIGGKEVDGKAYYEVGALSLVDASGAKFTCTGTLISSSTVLTAAHCLRPYGAEITAGHMIFTFGKIAENPDSPPIQVASFAVPGFPDALDPSNSYNPDGYKNDIGLAYLVVPENKVTKFPKRFAEPPLWTALKSNEATLIIVGYGDVLNGEKGSPDRSSGGLKRWVYVRLSDYNSKQAMYQFNVLGTSACHGDSGGPTYLVSTKGLIAVTSTAPELCQGEGVQTRVDAFQKWITSHIKG